MCVIIAETRTIHGQQAGQAPKVLVALSGGVDSAMAVRLLQGQGYAVCAAYIVFSPVHMAGLAAAERAAGELGVPFSVLHCEERFSTAVVDHFCAAYAAGRTPSPCVLCNPLVKFRVLAEEAGRLGIPFLASGHYARIVEEEGLFYLAKAHSAERDQSYMLYRLPQEILKRLLLPLGACDKPSMRRMAEELGLSCATAPDSQEICFLPGIPYPRFLELRGTPCKPGRFRGPAGEDLGPHKGVWHYTVGQRKGLGIALGYPAYVRSIDGNGDVWLVPAGGEGAEGVTLRALVTANGLPPAAGGYEVKVRSAAKPVPCHIPPGRENTLLFSAPVRGAAPGQHAVLYRGNRVVGGGEIDETLYPAAREP